MAPQPSLARRGPPLPLFDHAVDRSVRVNFDGYVHHGIAGRLDRPGTAAVADDDVVPRVEDPKAGYVEPVCAGPQGEPGELSRVAVAKCLATASADGDVEDPGVSRLRRPDAHVHRYAR